MTGILKELDFAITYLDDIIIFSTTVKEHLSHIKQVFEKLCTAKLSMKFSKCHFFTKEMAIFRTHPQQQGHPTITFKNTGHPEYASTQNAKTRSHLPWISRVLQKIYQKFHQNSQTINTPKMSASEI